jgi:hypothetical protein
MALNPSIILAGNNPDIFGSYARGQQVGQQAVENRRMNALAQLYQDQGPQIAAGDRNALNALARFDPQAAMGVEQTRARMDAISAQERRQAEEYAASKSAAERQATAARIEEGVRMGMAAQTPEQWDAMMAQVDPSLVGMFGQRQMIANKYMTMAEILKGQQPEKPADEYQRYVQEEAAAGRQPLSRIEYAQALKGPQVEKPMTDEGKYAYDRQQGWIGEGVGPKVEPPMTKNVKLADGSEALVQWNPQTQEWDPAPVPQGGTGAQPRDKLTDSQAQKVLFQSLQRETAPVLNQIEQAWNPANIGDAAARSTPIAGNFFQSQPGQIYSAAAAAWAEGALRLATGAAATQPEIERTVRTYFAQPGDTPATIEFKRSLRDAYERSIRRSLGERGVAIGLGLPADFAASIVPQGVQPAPAAPPESKAGTTRGIKWRIVE